jgi:hypothetical protein
MIIQICIQIIQIFRQAFVDATNYCQSKNIQVIPNLNALSGW